MARAQDPDSADSQFYISLGPQTHLDHAYTVFGQVVEGMDVADMLNAEYGSTPQNAQGRIVAEGNKFLIASFPKLDYVKAATIAQ